MDCFRSYRAVGGGETDKSLEPWRKSEGNRYNSRVTVTDIDQSDPRTISHLQQRPDMVVSNQ